MPPGSTLRGGVRNGERREKPIFHPAVAAINMGDIIPAIQQNAIDVPNRMILEYKDL
jgi:hypothetical protein